MHHAGMGIAVRLGLLALLVVGGLGARWLWVATYVGAAYGTFDDELRAVGGIRWRLPLGFTVGGIYDGEQLHLIGEYRFRKHVFSVLWVELEDLGVAYSIAF